MQALPKPPDRQKSLNDKASERVLPDVNPKGRPLTSEDRVNYRPPPKSPYILNVDGEVIGIIEKENLPYVGPKPRPPLKHGNADRKGIRDPEKECLLDMEPNYRPPPKVCDIARVPWTR